MIDDFCKVAVPLLRFLEQTQSIPRIQGFNRFVIFFLFSPYFILRFPLEV